MVRGSGQTTAQMQRAPQGAIFISCCTMSVEYDKRLARGAGRTDLTIMSPAVFDDRSLSELRSINKPVVVDHAFHTHPETKRARYEGYDRARREIFSRMPRDPNL